MDVLVDMTHEDLQSIGVTAFGDRHRILRSVKELAHSGGAGEPWGGGGQSIYIKWQMKAKWEGNGIWDDKICGKEGHSLWSVLQFVTGSSASQCMICLAS